MAQQSVRASGLTRVQVRPGKDEDSRALILTDTRKKSKGYLINPEGLNAILTPLLGLAVEWSDKTDLELGTLTGPANALPANRLVIERGRNDTEAAVRAFVGNMELTFLIPLDNLMAGLRQFIEQIDPTSGKPAN